MKFSKLSQARQKRHQSYINPSASNSSYIQFNNANINLNNRFQSNSNGNTPLNNNNIQNHLLTKKINEVQTQYNFGKQSNIITNLRLQLTNLKQEVSKLMYNNTTQSQIVQNDKKTKQKQKDKDSNINFSYRNNRKPSSLNRNALISEQNQSYVMNVPRFELMIGNQKQIAQIKKTQQINIGRIQSSKFFENQKLSQQLKASYARQKQLLRQNKRLMQTLSKQNSKNQDDKALLNLNISYLKQIQEMKNTQKQLQFQIQSKNKTIQSQKQKNYSIYAQFDQKLKQANNDNINKTNQINQLKSALNQLQKKFQLSIQDFNRLSNDQAQINKIKQKLLCIQSQNQLLRKTIDQKDQLNKQKDNQIKYLKSTLKTQQTLKQDNMKTIEQLKIELISVKESLKLNKQNIQSLNKQKRSLVQKQKNEVSNLIKQKQQLNLKLNQMLIKVEGQCKNQKSIIILQTQKNESIQKLKSELKIKQKTISNLINDVQHLQHDLRQYHFNKGYYKSMQDYIQQINQEKILIDLQNLNKRHLTKQEDIQSFRLNQNK